MSAQHTLEEGQDVIMDSSVEPEMESVLLTWLKTELNWCLGLEGKNDEGYSFRLCYLSQTQMDLEGPQT